MQLLFLLFLHLILLGIIHSVQATMSSSLTQFAIEAVSRHPKSHIEMAMMFASKACPAFVTQDNDRLLKVGRSLHNLIFLKDKVPLEASLQQLVDECNLLCSGNVKVSKE